MSYANEDIADPILYRTYYSLMMGDICRARGLPPTKYVKERLHEIHKKVLKYNTIAGRSQKTVGTFLFEVCALWACYGVFVRTRKDQPVGIENYRFQDEIEINGKKKRIWDLL